MFCLGCGAETPAHASACAVCGRAIAGALGPGTAGRPVASSAGAAVHDAPALRHLSSPDVGLPRDTLGRLLLLTALAMLADLLLPWSNSFGERLPLARLGLPALALAALIALAGAPLARAEYRLDTKVVVLPLVIGAFCLGLGVTYWVFLARENTQALALNPASSDTVPDGPVISADIGLYLFVLGAGALAVIGYQLFLAAARAGAAAIPAAATPSAATAAASATPASAHQVGNAQSAAATSASQPAAPPSPASALTPATEVRGSPPTSVILPGSAAWNEAPRVPVHVRASTHLNGWRRPSPHGR